MRVFNDLSRPQDLGPTRGAAFDTVAKAEKAVQRLRAAGFTDDQLLAVCLEEAQRTLTETGGEPFRE